MSKFAIISQGLNLQLQSKTLIYKSLAEWSNFESRTGSLKPPLPDAACYIQQAATDSGAFTVDSLFLLLLLKFYSHFSFFINVSDIEFISTLDLLLRSS